MEKIRISKLLAQRKICSRREAEQLLMKGLILLNGEVVKEQGTKAFPKDSLEILEEGKEHLKKKATLVFHKPLGIVSNLPSKGYQQASSFITLENQWEKDPYSFSLSKEPFHVVGRLDINSKGLLLLTQDGRVAKAIIGPNSSIEKEYVVEFTGKLTERSLSLLKKGLSLEGKKLKKATVEPLGENKLRFILKEGKKRQIRRMCEMVSLEVVSLERIRIGPFLLPDLPMGKWRFLGKKELSKLNLS